MGKAKAASLYGDGADKSDVDLMNDDESALARRFSLSGRLCGYRVALSNPPH